MLSAPYITDNPFRLLGIGAATLQPELRSKANAADKAAKVGIPPETGLLQVFGAEDVLDCANQVRTLANKPKERTIYRLFWPLAYQPQADFKGSLQDMLLLKQNVHGSPGFFETHSRFLSFCFSYLVEHKPAQASKALEFFSILFQDAKFDEFLTELLQQEGESIEKAEQCVCEATVEARSMLLSSICRQAGDDFEVGRVPGAITLLNSVIESKFVDNAIDAALLTFGPYGEREAARISEAIKDYEGWSPGQPFYDASEIKNLSLLAETLKGHCVNAALWLKTVENRIQQVAIAMRSAAIDLANDKNEYEQASLILSKVQDLPLSNELARKIRADQADLKPLIQKQKEQVIWEQVKIKPVETAPQIMTINGLGFKLYGRSVFPLRPQWYFTTDYFVVFYFPILPVRRYLVSDAPKGGWQFYGRVPFTKANKIHLAAALLLPVIFLLYSSLSSKPDTASNDQITAAEKSAYDANLYKTPKTDIANSETPQKMKPSGRKEVKKEEPAVVPETVPTNSAPDIPDASLTPPAAPSIDANAEEKQRLNEEYDKLKLEADEERPSLQTRREDLDARHTEIESERQTLDHTDKAALDAFNEKVDQLNSDNNQFDADVKEFNRKINRVNEIVARLKELN